MNSTVPTDSIKGRAAPVAQGLPPPPFSLSSCSSPSSEGLRASGLGAGSHLCVPALPHPV